MLEPRAINISWRPRQLPDQLWNIKVPRQSSGFTSTTTPDMLTGAELAVLVTIIYLFWQGLGVGTLALAGLCLFCVAMAIMLSGRAATMRQTERRGNGGARSLKSWWRAGSSRILPTAFLKEPVSYPARARYPAGFPARAEQP